MYDWLADALSDSSQTVTASRRLARVLVAEFGDQQVAVGHTAWRSPSIRSLQDWLSNLITTTSRPETLPTRINTHQSRVLWEKCLRHEISDPLLNTSMLVRQSWDSWLRLHEFSVPLDEVEPAAQGKDQRLFARAARNYQSILDREHWIDEAGIPGLVTSLVQNGIISLPPRITLAGFDRVVPQVAALLDAVRAAGTSVEEAPVAAMGRDGSLYSYESTDAELRAAGAWARLQLEQTADQRIAVVVTNLEQDAARCARLLREGLVPGWQLSGSGHGLAVNVSYGSKLSAYPAIAIALLVMRWLRSDASTRDISLLLRSSMIGCPEVSGRCRLEMILRQLPDQNWSPAMLLGKLNGRDATPDARDWLSRVSDFEKLRSELPRRAAPSSWAVLIDEVLKSLNWPGDETLDSFEFQLVNRWRELLNDLARLELVSPTMTIAEALGRLATMANETVFQAEAAGAIVHLIGPLEAAGMQFDKLWINGLSASNWPPPGRPSSLLSRKLQRDYNMPNAAPEDTLDYARRVLNRLAGSAASFVCSYAQADGDAEQTETALLRELGIPNAQGTIDPGWHATKLVDAAALLLTAPDPVPAVSRDEVVSGGANTIQRQVVEPFAAFVYGRLGVRALQTIGAGLSASLRGNLIHDTLHRLYADLPSRLEIANWSEDALRERIESAVQKSFWRYMRHADPVLIRLFALEQRRVHKLMRDLVNVDRERNDFEIAEVEGSLETTMEGVQLSLRFDRIDRLKNGELLVLDYKTGMRKKFLDSDAVPKDVQLVVYACALEDPVGGLALVNIDSRQISIDGAGRDLTPELNWDDVLAQWKSQVRITASQFQRGDVRINGLQNIQATRPLSLLSRIGELRRDD
jgi:probable DNA repair protein